MRRLQGVIFVLLGSLWTRVWCQETCKKYSSCACSYGDTHIDLTPLGSKDGPKWKDERDTSFGNDYSYNPCYSFTEGDCVDTAVCQVMTSSSQYFECGTQESAEFFNDGESGQLALKYTKTDDSGFQRTSEVILNCLQEGSSDSLDVHGEEPTTPGLYKFTLNSIHCCKKSGGGGGSGGSGALSVGSILVIVFFVLLVVYLSFGIVLQKVARKAQGKDLLPNYTFWAALPGLVKDGTLFVVRGCKKPPGYSDI